MNALQQIAEQLGREDRQAYADEFGMEITPTNCGDWDGSAISEAWRIANRKIEIDPNQDWNEFRSAYLTALHARPID